MKMMKEDKLRILSILSNNLANPQPQVVDIETIAAATNLGLKETRQLLLRMDQDGEIQSDMDGKYSLITLAGLSSLNAALLNAAI
ncbi:MAG: putative Rossmann fold nucleotide-binding protein DprA/Smf involved in DNA uptake [Desulforhopalus sp.]|jgi:predicted Rossmann fold nucleotide-binding protein DprA/Smf involved in DNA uptake